MAGRSSSRQGRMADTARMLTARATVKTIAAMTAVGLAPAFAAARARLGVVAVLFGLAGVAWWSTADRMRGMDGSPSADLGALGWFLGVWLVMMAAMMLPSAAPTVALYARMVRRRRHIAPLLFTGG